MSPAADSLNQAEKLATERIAEGDITCVRLAGVMDESFEGKRLASQIKSKIVILEMGNVVKISSFGVREWSEFLAALSRTTEQIFIIECRPKVMDQANMVAGFLGGAKLISFYAPYHCDVCDVDQDYLLQVDRDGSAIRAYAPPEHSCATCSRPMQFDEDPVSYFSVVAQQPQFDLPGSVPEFLTSKLGYSLSGGNRRLQIEKTVDKRHTYLALSGNLDGSFVSEKVAEGLEGIVVVDLHRLGGVNQAGAAEWRNFIALASQGAERVSVVDCPPLLLERLPDSDLGFEIVSFSMPYTCAACKTTTSETIDVAEHFDLLKFATPPEMRCSNCKQSTVCTATEALLLQLRSLKKPTTDSQLKNFVKMARKRKEEERDKEEVAPTTGLSRRAIFGLSGGLVAVLAASGAVLYSVQSQNQTIEKLEKGNIASTNDTKVDRPAWVTIETPSQGACLEKLDGVSCVGVSEYVLDVESGTTLALDTALETMVFNLAIGFESQDFDDLVRPIYSQGRNAALAAMQESAADRQGSSYKEAAEVVRSARRRSREALMSANGDVVPRAHSALYWEEYEAPGGGSEFLVFVRVDISKAAFETMGRRYTEGESAAGLTSVVNAFPLLSWGQNDFKGGAMVLDPGASSNVKKGSIIVKAGGNEVFDVASLRRSAPNATTPLETIELTPLQ